MGLKERRKREKQARKKQILDAARDLLFDKGLHAISVNMIARKAELGVGTIYFYFSNKEEIFSVLQQEGLSILHEKICDINRAAVQPEEKLRRIAHEYLRFSNDQKNYFDIINYFLSAPQIIFSPDIKQRIDSCGVKILSLLADIIENGISRGRFKPMASEKCAVMFWAALHGLIQIKKLQPTVLKESSHRDVYCYSVERLIEGFRAKPAPVV